MLWTRFVLLSTALGGVSFTYASSLNVSTIQSESTTPSPSLLFTESDLVITTSVPNLQTPPSTESEIETSFTTAKTLEDAKKGKQKSFIVE